MIALTDLTAKLLRTLDRPDLERVIAALNDLEPIERFIEVVAGIEASSKS